MDLADKLMRLAEDLRAIGNGHGPSNEDLANAPILYNWHLAYRPATILRGVVVGHPRLGMGHIDTSLVYRLDPDRRWARTQSRYYRLSKDDDDRSPEQ